MYTIGSGWGLLVLVAVLGSLVWMFLKYPFGCTILIVLFLLLLALLTASCASRDGVPALTSATAPGCGRPRPVTTAARPIPSVSARTSPRRCSGAPS